MKKLNDYGHSVVMYLVMLAVLGAVGATGWYVYNKNKVPKVKSPASAIKSFEDCVKAGNPVQESHPRVCTDKDGNKFTESVAAAHDETSGWLHYTSSKSTYSLRVPDGWNLIQTNANLENIFAVNNSDMTYKTGTLATVKQSDFAGDGPKPFSIYVPGAYYDQIVHQGTKQSDFSTDQGKTAQKFYYEQATEQDGIGYAKGAKVYNYYFGTDGKYLQIEHVVNPGAADQHELVEKALKTLEVK